MPVLDRYRGYRIGAAPLAALLRWKAKGLSLEEPDSTNRWTWNKPIDQFGLVRPVIGGQSIDSLPRESEIVRGIKLGRQRLNPHEPACRPDQAPLHHGR